MLSLLCLNDLALQQSHAHIHTASCPSPPTPVLPDLLALGLTGIVNMGLGWWQPVFADFRPVSYSADPRPDSPEFHQHRGYEADLLDALEAMDGAGLTFSRRAIGGWPGIWLRATEPKFAIIGGGITILDSRTRNATGDAVVTFTSGHITSANPCWCGLLTWSGSPATTDWTARLGLAPWQEPRVSTACWRSRD